MHEDVALVGVHYDEAVVARVVEELQAAGVALRLACLNWGRDRRRVRRIGVVIGNGLGRCRRFVGLALGGREWVDGHVLRIVQVAF